MAIAVTVPSKAAAKPNYTVGAKNHFALTAPGAGELFVSVGTGAINSKNQSVVVSSLQALRDALLEAQVPHGPNAVTHAHMAFDEVESAAVVGNSATLTGFTENDVIIAYDDTFASSGAGVLLRSHVDRAIEKFVETQFKDA